ncbi:MAG: hypothetical protein JW819_01740 [Candidatus Krumholzibacteriota bacterium]|nr:hypothetical protein [Candidatus Krumholzibacteriota bacterium]
MKKLLATLLALCLSAGAVMADTMTFSWEDGTSTILGSYLDIIATNDGTMAYTGSRSLKLEDNAASGTPQAYIAWVYGLTDGDIVTASFWRYDDTPGASPSCRIWGHWNDTADIGGYNGSAGGNDDYGPGEGWDQTSWSWTVADGHTGLVIEVRTYSVPGDTVWVDDLSVTAPVGAVIMIPDGSVPAAATSWTQVKALY